MKSNVRPTGRVLVLICGLAAVLFLTFSESASTASKVTFAKDVAPILYKSCAECHRAGEIAPMSLMTYQEVGPWAKSIRERVVERSMPPWSADPKYGHWANDPRLSQAEIDTIVEWVNAGAPKGEDKDLPPLLSLHRGGRSASRTWFCRCKKSTRFLLTERFRTCISRCRRDSPKTNGFRQWRFAQATEP